MKKHSNKKFAHLPPEEAENRRLRTNEYERRRQHKISDKFNKIKQALESNDNSRDNVLAIAHSYILFLERKGSNEQFSYSPELEKEFEQNDFETHFKKRIAHHKNQAALMQESQCRAPDSESMQQDSLSCQARGKPMTSSSTSSALKPIGNGQCKRPQPKSVGLMSMQDISIPISLQSDFSLPKSAVPFVAQPVDNGHLAGNTIPLLSSEIMTAPDMMDCTTGPYLKPAIDSVHVDSNILSGHCTQIMTAPALQDKNIVGGSHLQNFTDSAMAERNTMTGQHTRPHTSPAIFDTERNTGPVQCFQPVTDSIMVDNTNVIGPYTQLLTAPMEKDPALKQYTQPFTTPATVGGTSSEQSAWTSSYPLIDTASCSSSSHPLAGPNKKKRQRKSTVSHTKSRVSRLKTTPDLVQVSQRRVAATPCPPHRILYYNYTTANQNQNFQDNTGFSCSTSSSSESGGWPKELSSTTTGIDYLLTPDLSLRSNHMETDNNRNNENQAKTSAPTLEHQPVNSMTTKPQTHQVYPLNEVSDQIENVPLSDRLDDDRQEDNLLIPGTSNLSGRNGNRTESEQSHSTDVLNQQLSSSSTQSQVASGSDTALSQTTTQEQQDLISFPDKTVSLEDVTADIKSMEDFVSAMKGEKELTIPEPEDDLGSSLADFTPSLNFAVDLYIKGLQSGL